MFQVIYPKSVHEVRAYSLYIIPKCHAYWVVGERVEHFMQNGTT
jgi:hypothetical protein